MYAHWYKILGIEGGGARGVYPLGVLRNIKSILGEFDLLAGTSTGGIIVLALAMGIDPEVIVQWYYEKLPRIFSKTTWQKVRSFFGLKHGFYSSEELVKACKEFFGDRKMKDLSRRVVVFAYDTAHAELERIDSSDPRYGDMYLWEAAVATASAPIYLPGFIKDDKSLIDGGVYAGSPAKEAHRLSMSQARPVYLLNIGTGYKYFKAYTRTWGIKNWFIFKGGNSLSTVIFQASKKSDHDYLKDLAKNKIDDFAFKVIDTELNSGITMDTTDITLLEALYELGKNENTNFVLDDLIPNIATYV